MLRRYGTEERDYSTGGWRRRGVPARAPCCTVLCHTCPRSEEQTQGLARHRLGRRVEAGDDKERGEGARGLREAAAGRVGRAACRTAPQPAVPPCPADVLTEQAVEYIHGYQTDPRPFFLYLTPYAAHRPHIPAARHLGVFKGGPPRLLAGTPPGRPDHVA